MRNVICTGLAVLGLLATVSCGGDDDGSSSDPLSQCKKVASTVCSKFYDCFTEAELDAAASIVGNNEADCVTKQESELDCTTEGTKCDSGETYQADKAQECVSQFQAFSCDEFKGFATGATTTPAACDQVCQ